MFLLFVSWSLSLLLVVGAKGAGESTTKSKASSVAVVPQTNPSSQYHAQDEFGQYSYGYLNADGQSKAEVKGIDGSIAGKYSYIDGNGKHVEVAYVADHGGFRAVGDHLPNNQVPEVPEVPPYLAEAYREANKRLSDAYVYYEGKAAASKEKQGKVSGKEEEKEEKKDKDEEKGGSSGENSEEEEEEDEEEKEEDEESKKEEKESEKGSVAEVKPGSKLSLVPPASISTPILIGQVQGYQHSVIKGTGHYVTGNVNLQQNKTPPRLVYIAGDFVTKPVASSYYLVAPAKPVASPYLLVAPAPVAPAKVAPAPMVPARVALAPVAPAKVAPGKVALVPVPPAKVAPSPVTPAKVAPPVAIQGATVRLIQSAPIRATEYSFHTYVPTIHHQQSTQKGIGHVPVHDQYTGQVSQAQSQYASRIAIAPGYGYIPMPYSA